MASIFLSCLRMELYKYTKPLGTFISSLKMQYNNKFLRKNNFGISSQFSTKGMTNFYLLKIIRF